MYEWDDGAPEYPRLTPDITRRVGALMRLLGNKSGRKQIDVDCGDAFVIEFLENSGIDS